MFEQSILEGAVKTRRAWTVMTAFAGQLVLVGVGVLIPLIAFDKLPVVRIMPPVVAPPLPPPPQKPPHVDIVDVRFTSRPSGGFVEPSRIPPTVTRIVDTPQPPVENWTSGPGVPGGIGPSDGVVGGIPGGMPQTFRLPPPPKEPTPVAKPADPQPIRIRIGTMIAAKLIHRVEPVYPKIAVLTRTSGIVRLQAVIGRDGRIRELQVLSGHGLLVPAAIDAVRQWVYRPTILNGDPVEVLTTIDVIFKLSQ
jgi:protein TonB